jgi:hypothetical protein
MVTKWTQSRGGYRAQFEDLIDNDELTATGYLHLPDGRWVFMWDAPTKFYPHYNWDGKTTHRSAFVDGLRYKIIMPD